MFKKNILFGVMVMIVTATLPAQAKPTPQQMRDGFEKKMVVPCQGKQAGDEVSITGRHGENIPAICTLTAIPAAK